MPQLEGLQTQQMTNATMSETATTNSTARLYLVRAVVALAWAGLLVIALSSSGSLTPQESVPAFAVALLISYPLIDLVASLIDARTQQRRGPPRNATTQLVNATISGVTAIVLAVTTSHGADAVLRVFGAWAILTGLIQLTLGILRHRRGTPGQWPMILSGGISTVAGLSFILKATGTNLNLSNLAGYATLGAVFFLVSAWRQRSRGAATGA
jgi:uncharacterized membrane protein HdeD (DUF308 family)